ncbi:MAG: hypothetical protein K2I00_09520 [Ruminococcus sp.]|nr:hypothetical protein [Ruminococcus sp.]
MKILNIHGYKGSAENSACLVLKEMGFDVISPQIDYDAENPEKILDNLRKIFTESKPDYIVGTSLGGFFALLLSVEFKAVRHNSYLQKKEKCNYPTILVNPCLLPFVTLPELGYEKNIKEFIGLFGKFTNIYGDIYAIIGGQDEVIDYHDFTIQLIGKRHYILVPNGKHSGATLNLDVCFRRLIK